MKIEMCDLIIWDYSYNENLPPDGIKKVYYFVHCDPVCNLYIRDGGNMYYDLNGFITMRDLAYREYGVSIGDIVYYDNSLYTLDIIYEGNKDIDELLCSLRDYYDKSLFETEVSINDVYNIKKQRNKIISCVLE